MKKIKFDHTRLQELMLQKGITREQLAAELQISECQLCSRMKGRSRFSLPEIDRIVGLLGLTDTEIDRCFFTTEKDGG